jgi:hypothetical protein
MDELTLADTNTTETEKKPKATKSTKSTAKTSTKRKSTSPKSPGGKKPKAPIIEISNEQRLGMIAEAAYYKAQQRGFAGGNPVDDWLTAESEVDALLANNPDQQAIA